MTGSTHCDATRIVGTARRHGGKIARATHRRMGEMRQPADSESVNVSRTAERMSTGTKIRGNIPCPAIPTHHDPGCNRIASSGARTVTENV